MSYRASLTSTSLTKPTYTVADPGCVCDRGDHPPPLELVPILKTYVKCAWPDQPPPPPLECGWRHTGNVQGGVLANVQEWGCFSKGGWRLADNAQGGGGCLWMSKSGGVCVLVNVFTPPPPFQEILYPRLLYFNTHVLTVFWNSKFFWNDLTRSWA